MRETGWNQDKTARGIGLQSCGIVFASCADIPRTFDYRNKFVLWVGVGGNMRSRRYFDAVNPRAALAGIAIELRPLAAIGVVGRREPRHLRGEDSDNVAGFLIFLTAD